MEIINRFQVIDDENLKVQCDVFCGENRKDEMKISRLNQMNDTNNPTDLFNAILAKVSHRS